jgi:hypothetical protein
MSYFSDSFGISEKCRKNFLVKSETEKVLAYLDFYTRRVLKFENQFRKRNFWRLKGVDFKKKES